jgi:hypothetical protein
VAATVECRTLDKESLLVIPCDEPKGDERE